jgi:drug/metabolite transporter (DMT)-like permease
MIPALLAAILFAMSSASARRSVSFLGPAAANFWRQLGAVLLLAAYAHTVGTGFGGPALGWFLASGVVGYGLGDTGIFLALPRIGSRLTSLMTQCLAAPIGALVEWVWLAHRPTWIEAAAGGLILAGVGVAVAPGRKDSTVPSPTAAGIACGLVAAIGQAGGAVLSRVGFQAAAGAGVPADPLSVTYVRAFAGLWVGLAWYLVALRSGSLPPLGDGLRRGWAWTLGNLLAGPTLGVICYQWALAGHSTAEVLPITAMTPLFVIPFAYWLEGERPSKRSLSGGAVAVAGVVWLARAK